MPMQINEQEWMATQFEAHRAHLKAVAYRMLGSPSEAEDAVQEAWLRLNRAGADGVDNLGGWLRTVVARVSLDMLRSRKARREERIDERAPAQEGHSEDRAGPDHAALLADSVGQALLVILDTLAPAERLAFVLHDMFAVPFDEIAPIIGCTPVAARQLASRGRRRVEGKEQVSEADDLRRQTAVDAFLVAARTGNFEALLAVLDPGVVLRADSAAVALGAPAEISGAAVVAKHFAGRAKGAQGALLDGIAAVVWAPRGQLRVAFDFTITDGRIVGIQLRADPAHLAELDVMLLPPVA